MQEQPIQNGERPSASVNGQKALNLNYHNNHYNRCKHNENEKKKEKARNISL
jgi:hypothetical protein